MGVLTKPGGGGVGGGGAHLKHALEAYIAEYRLLRKSSATPPRNIAHAKPLLHPRSDHGHELNRARPVGTHKFGAKSLGLKENTGQSQPAGLAVGWLHHSTQSRILVKQSCAAEHIDVMLTLYHNL